MIVSKSRSGSFLKYDFWRLWKCYYISWELSECCAIKCCFFLLKEGSAFRYLTGFRNTVVVSPLRNRSFVSSTCSRCSPLHGYAMIGVLLVPMSITDSVFDWLNRKCNGRILVYLAPISRNIKMGFKMDCPQLTSSTYSAFRSRSPTWAVTGFFIMILVNLVYKRTSRRRQVDEISVSYWVYVCSTWPDYCYFIQIHGPPSIMSIVSIAFMALLRSNRK
jgi:hypothetical protein